MDETELRLTKPQTEFFRKWFECKDSTFIAFVAGFGSGKSEILHIISVLTIATHPWANVAIYAPTYDLIKLNNVPRIQVLLDNFGLKYKFNKADFIFDIEGHGNIILRSMDNPGRIIAYEVFISLTDELDTMSTKQAEEAWNKLIARNRQQPATGDLVKKGTLIKWDHSDEPEILENDMCMTSDMEVINKCGVFTTPEGFKFTYRKWEKETNEGYTLVRASTYSNPHLPKSYVKNLRDSYPSQLIEAYLNGQFVNLTGGRVYHSFDRTLHSFNADEFIPNNQDLTMAVIG
jgi:hypothetical protein